MDHPRNDLGEEAFRTRDAVRNAVAAISLEDLDPSRPEGFVDNSSLEVCRRLREEDPVHRTKSSMFGEYWSLTRYEDIMAVDTNATLFSSDVRNGGVGLQDTNPNYEMLPMFISTDPPKHTEQRLAVAPIFSPARLAYLETLIRGRAQKLLDSVPVGEPFDWVDTISVELTTQMLTTLFDFPWEERRKLTRWSDVTGATPGGGIIDSEEQRRRELGECLEYFLRLWEEKANAAPAPDVISMLAHSPATRNMDPKEYLGNVVLLMVGGNDTTRNSITGGLYALNIFPQEFAKVRESPDLVPNMVSEIIRWQSPIAFQRRTALEDTEIAGTPIRKGDRIAMWYMSGNRDGKVFERPDDLVIDRPNARRNMAFGFGIHRCFGFRLAEMQLRIVWEEILKRWKFIEVLQPPQPIHSYMIRGYSYMPVHIKT
jgi:cytochrome P450